MEKDQTGFELRHPTEADLDDVFNVLNQAFDDWPGLGPDIDDPRAHLTWKCHSSPDSMGRHVIMVHAGAVIGAMVRIARRVKVRDLTVKAQFGVDSSLVPEFQGRGLFTRMDEHGVERAARQEVALQLDFGGHPASVHFFKKQRIVHPRNTLRVLFLPIATMRAAGRVEGLRASLPRFVVATGIWLKATASRIRHGRSRPPEGGNEIETIKEFDDSTADLWESVAQDFDFIPVRDRDYDAARARVTNKMKDFSGKLAVITGGGSGMGRELAVQLSAQGCAVAMCDLSTENLEATTELCRKGAPTGTEISTHMCDVSDESQVLTFRDEVEARHPRGHINLLFNNAGIGGGGSFVSDSRDEWEKTFGVCWFGVYYCTRAFMPLLIASDVGHLINTSSVNGFWATLGADIPHTAYSSAKFAVKGFSEALINDLRVNAPHVSVSVVMPGHIGTNIAINTGRILGQPDPLDLPDEEIEKFRGRLNRSGADVGALNNDQLRIALKQRGVDFRELAPTTSAQAASIILEGVASEQWRILVGDDAAELDRRVRETPEAAYEPDFYDLIVRSRQSAP